MKYCVLLICLMFLFSGCRSSTQTFSQTKRIALITKSDKSYFWQVVNAGAQTAAAEYGIQVDMYAPPTEDDYLSQINIVEKVVTEKYDAIIFSASNYDKMVSPIETAMDAGIEIVTIDSGIGTNRNIMFIGTDNRSAGYKVGEALMELVDGTANVGIINFEEFSANGMERNEGLLEYIEEHSDMKLVDLRYCNSNREDPRKAALEMLTMYPEINAIATFNEWTTLGVGDAVSELRLADKVAVVAFDNNEDAVDMLESGIIDALIVQNSFAIGYLGVEYVLAQLRGEKPDELTIYTDSVLITADNMYTAQNQKLLFPFQQQDW